MPTTMDEQQEWSYIGYVDEEAPNKGRQLLYKTGAEKGKPVRVKVYGTVKGTCLKALGDWCGYVSGLGVTV